MTSIIVSDIPAENSNNANLVGQLFAFFNVETHPTAIFFLNSYVDGVAQGDLTLNGITKTIEFLADIVVSKEGVATIVADFYIPRSEWNLVQWDGLVQEELKISLDLIANGSSTDIVEATIDIVEDNTINSTNTDVMIEGSIEDNQ